MLNAFSGYRCALRHRNNNQRQVHQNENSGGVLDNKNVTKSEEDGTCLQVY